MKYNKNSHAPSSLPDRERATHAPKPTARDVSSSLAVSRPECVNCHALPLDDLFLSLNTSRKGLHADHAASRLRQVGRNELPVSAGNESLKILVRQIHNPLIYVLLGSTVLAMLTGKLIDGLVICGVVVLNALIGFVQEHRASKAIRSLSAMVPQNAAVVRDGTRHTVPATDVVPGDIVLLESGDKVPADARLIAIRTLRLDESPLTGESVPVEKRVEASDEHTPLADRRGMVYSGTLVTQGVGRAVVVATGQRTELGRISHLLSTATDLQTPLTRQLGVVGMWIAGAIMAISVVLLGISLLRGYPLSDAVLAAVTLAVAAIPEGLPAIVTIALAIGVQRMAGRGAVMRKLASVETLGSTTIICSDKTGTLTRNEMTVQVLAVPENGGTGGTGARSSFITQARKASGWIIRYALSGVGYRPNGMLQDADGSPLEDVPSGVRELTLAGLLCNDAALVERDGTWHVNGDPTEGALLVSARKSGHDVDETVRKFPRLDAIPFESERQFMATLHDGPVGRLIFLKGAPEVILARCSGLRGESVLEEVQDIASHGMRVLAFAVRSSKPDVETLHDADVEGGFRFLGLQGMIDPPRPEAIASVRACRNAGITVKMITGDHPETARAIGETLGLVGEGEAAVAGASLSELSGEELDRKARRHHVFARVAPEHKLRLVQALQAQGHVVAMTGDGVNDAPALKQADIGVAMGIAGTAVSRDAADMVLSDDNFASIAAAVEEGRRVYDNLIKALAFVLPTNLGLALILIASVSFFPIVGGQPLLPMQPVQILWINLVAAVALALPLAFEAMEPGLMRRPPRSPGAPLLNAFVMGRTAVMAVLMAAGALGLFLLEYESSMDAGISPVFARAVAQTEAVLTVILFQIFYLFQCRSLTRSTLSMGLWTNPWIYAGIAVVLLLQAGFIYLPFMNAVFGSAPLDAEAWLKAFVVAFIGVPVVSLEKWWRGRRGGAR